MRPIAVIGLAVLLSGCSYASSPFAGFPHYLADTHGLVANPNAPQGTSETMQRVRGGAVTLPPLRAEPGNVWPTPVKAEPTLQYYERQMQEGALTTPSQPTRPGSAAPSVSATGPAIPLKMPPAPPPTVAPPPTLGKVTVVNGDVATAGGVAHLSTDPNGVITYTMSNGTKGIAVSNGNGTLTLIGPDGSVQTVNAPKK
ncbi:MAG: hypothetical protein KGK10_12260 [Rhodospirillales bacterium]|nr:hypothetical protein [Rhodospirillales bacterium]